MALSRQVSSVGTTMDVPLPLRQGPSTATGFMLASISGWPSLAPMMTPDVSRATVLSGWVSAHAGFCVLPNSLEMKVLNAPIARLLVGSARQAKLLTHVVVDAVGTAGALPKHALLIMLRAAAFGHGRIA